MNKRWICSDVWMDILPSFDHAQLGLKMALLSDRFDFLVDKHFDGKSELTIWRAIEIRKDKGPKAKLSVRIDGKFVDFPLSDRQMPNKICFKSVRIDYIDHSVIEFLHANKRFFDRSGTKLELFIDGDETEDVQPIWDVFIREIWPIFATSIRHLGFPNGYHLDNLRRRTSPTILTDLDQLNSFDSGALLPDGIADDGPNATSGQALSKWLHTPTKNGQPKQLHRNNYSGPLNLEWVNNFKETFRRATTSVSYHIQLFFIVTEMPIEQFELVNKQTNEKLILKQSKEHNDLLYNWLLKRCPIGETVTDNGTYRTFDVSKFIKWEDSENLGANANLDHIRFDLWSFSESIGINFTPLSPPAEEEEKEEEADQSNQNVV